MSVEVLPIAESHAEGFRACLDIVAREKKYLAQIEAPPPAVIASHRKPERWARSTK